MIGNPAAQAALLLTVSLGKADRGGIKPLSAREWSRLAGWLGERGADPAALVESDFREILSGWEDRSVSLDRVDGLLGRSAALGLAAETWERAGLWIRARSEPGYPARLDRRLGSAAPPVLFGCGNPRLLENGGLAVVGSRDAGEDDLAFSEELGAAASKQGYSIVSGGARGVDRTAMKGALGSEGTAVAVLADGLLRAATSALYRRPLMSGDLALVSAVYPQARFNVGNAMGRNRYIYCLADAAVVVASAHGSGGTWNGACENAKAGWVPLWVRQTGAAGSGNPHLVANGARWLPEPLESVAALFARGDAAPPAAVPEDLDFFDLFLALLAGIASDEALSAADIAERLDIAPGQAKTWIERGVAEGSIEKVKGPVRYRAPHRERPLPLDGSAERRSAPHGLDFQQLLLARLERLSADEACPADAVARSIGVAPGQVREWLRRGVAAGRIRRTENPVRYRAPA